jgi:hypothetical protein
VEGLAYGNDQTVQRKVMRWPTGTTALLAIRRWSHTGAKLPTLGIHAPQQRFKNDMGQEFDLRAVVAHLGPTMDEGHYVTVLREPDADNWVRYSDASVDNYDPKGLQQLIDSSASLLVYAVVQPHVLFDRTRVAGAAPPIDVDAPPPENVVDVDALNLNAPAMAPPSEHVLEAATAPPSPSYDRIASVATPGPFDETDVEAAEEHPSEDCDEQFTVADPFSEALQRDLDALTRPNKHEL